MAAAGDLTALRAHRMPSRRSRVWLNQVRRGDARLPARRGASRLLRRDHRRRGHRSWWLLGHDHLPDYALSAIGEFLFARWHRTARYALFRSGALVIVGDRGWPRRGA